MNNKDQQIEKLENIVKSMNHDNRHVNGCPASAYLGGMIQCAIDGRGDLKADWIAEAFSLAMNNVNTEISDETAGQLGSLVGELVLEERSQEKSYADRVRS